MRTRVCRRASASALASATTGSCAPRCLRGCRGWGEGRETVSLRPSSSLSLSPLLGAFVFSCLFSRFRCHDFLCTIFLSSLFLLTPQLLWEVGRQLEVTMRRGKGRAFTFIHLFSLFWILLLFTHTHSVGAIGIGLMNHWAAARSWPHSRFTSFFLVVSHDHHQIRSHHTRFRSYGNFTILADCSNFLCAFNLIRVLSWFGRHRIMMMAPASGVNRFTTINDLICAHVTRPRDRHRNL